MFQVRVHWVTVTCCMFLIDGKAFICAGYREPCISEGLSDPGTGRGLTEPGSLCTDPPLPSDCPNFFLINFLSLALRFWNQIFTCERKEKYKPLQNRNKCFQLVRLTLFEKWKYEWNKGIIYLSLWKPEIYSQFGFSSDCDIAIKMKLFLQLQPLVICVHHSVLLLRSRFAWK